MLSCGIDTHQKMHEVELQNGEEKTMWKGRIGNDRQGFERLAGKLSVIERSNNQKIVGACINPTGNYHVPLQRFLQSKGYRVVAVNQIISASARKMDNLGRAKSDSVDAAALAAIPWRKRGMKDAHSHERDELSELTRMHETVDRNIIRIVNNIWSDLAVVFPEFPQLIDDLKSKTALTLLERYAVPANMAKPPVKELERVVSHASRNHFRKEFADELMKKASETVALPDGSGIFAFKIRENVKRLRAEMQELKRIDDEIRKRAADRKDVKLLDDMKGVSIVAAASAVSEIGHIGQFETAEKLQAYGGKSPRTSGSAGKSQSHGVARARNSHLARTAYTVAVSLVDHNVPESTICDREIVRGRKSTQALFIVSKRWLYHAHSMLKNNRPYRERMHPGSRRGNIESFGSGGTGLDDSTAPRLRHR